MRSPKEIINGDREVITAEEWEFMRDYIDNIARYQLSSFDFCCLLGWWVLDDPNIPLSPKEAGFD